MSARLNHYHGVGFAEVRCAALNQWERIHSALGVTLRTTSPQKHTPCPACGGRDRFRVGKQYQEYGQWYCSGGGDAQYGDGFTLLCHVHGWTLAEALKAVKEYLGLDARLTDKERDRIRKKSADQQARHAAMMRDREEQNRLFFNLFIACDNARLAMDCLDDEIKSHEYRQRQINQYIPFVNLPLFDSLLAANQALSAAMVELHQFAKEVRYG